MQSIKETAANVAASAKSGMEKTKATVQEKVDRMTAHNPTEKEMATERKDERINQAEWNKQEAHQHNAAAKHASHGTGQPHTFSTTGGHQMSALPGHGTGQPGGHVVEGTVGSHPIGTGTGTTRPSAAHNTHVGQPTNQGYGTGGAYS